MTPEWREELKPCPFCGGGPNDQHSNNCWFTMEAIGASKLSRATAWNRRAQVEALTVPQGWKLVPMEPDEDMVYAGGEGRRDQLVDAAGVYRAMLAAAPTIPAIPGTKEGA